MAGVVTVLGSPSLKRAFLMGLLLLVVVGVPGCGDRPTQQVGKSGDDSFSVDETPTAADPASLELILDVSNPSVVSNGGQPPSFTLTETRRVREISTYHWNDGKGTAAGGTLSLAGPGGTRELKVTRTGEGQGGVPNAVWIVDLDEMLQPGTYTISDSDSSTWAQNSETGGKGMTWVRAERR